MKKTLLITMDFYPTIGGIATYWENISLGMPSDKWIVMAPLLPIGVAEVHVPYTLYRRRFFATFLHWIPLVWKIIFIARKERVNYLIAGQILPIGTAVWIASLISGIPFGVSLHGMDIESAIHGKKRRAWLASCILRAGRFVIANSKDTAQRAIRAGAAKDHIMIIYPCATLSSSKVIVSDKKKDGPLLLTIARLVERKGHVTVIDALPRILERFPHCVYAIIGTGKMRGAINARALLNGVAEHVVFLGSVSDTKKTDWLSACDIFVMAPYEKPGDVEGFGIAYLEAALAEKPVVATRTGGVSEAVIDGETGILVEPQNSEQLADAVCRLLSDTSLAKRLSEVGRKRVETDFKWETQAQKLIHVLTYA